MPSNKATTPTSTTNPTLWLSQRPRNTDLIHFFSAVYTFADDPTADCGQRHIVCAEPDVSEVEVKAIALPLVAKGCQVTIFTAPRNLEHASYELLKPMTAQMADDAKDYADWARDRDNKLRLTPREAKKIIPLLLKYADPSTLEDEMEGLRERCEMKPYDWDEARRRAEKAYKNSPSGGKDVDTERIRLEIQGIAQEPDFIKRTTKIIDFCRRSGWSRRDVEQQIRLFKTSSTVPQAKRLKGKEFLALETESIGWLFPGIIPDRGVFVIGGHAGTGKTTFAYDAVGSLLLKEDFLGEKPVKNGKVLLVTGDELPCFTQDKLIDRGIPLNNENWEILLNWDTSQWDVLEDAIEDIRPALVVIDSFSSIHRDPSFDENSSQAKSTIYDLEALTNKYGCGCILIHHLSKSKDSQGVTRLRGSSAIAAAASVVCLMETGADGLSRRLTFPKVRGAQTTPFTVSLDGSTGRYQVLSGGDAPDTKSLGDRILTFLQREPDKRFEQDEISDALGIPRGSDSIYQALSRLHRRGLIIKRPSKTEGRKRVYGIASKDSSRYLTEIPDRGGRDQKNSENFLDPLPPPPEKVSGIFDETVEAQGLQIPDRFLTLRDKQRSRYGSAECHTNQSDTTESTIPVINSPAEEETTSASTELFQEGDVVIVLDGKHLGCAGQSCVAKVANSKPFSDGTWMLATFDKRYMGAHHPSQFHIESQDEKRNREMKEREQQVNKNTGKGFYSKKKR